MKTTLMIMKPTSLYDVVCQAAKNLGMSRYLVMSNTKATISVTRSGAIITVETTRFHKRRGWDTVQEKLTYVNNYFPAYNGEWTRKCTPHPVWTAGTKPQL